MFPNPDGWVAGDILGTEGAGFMATRGNDNGHDLNRKFPVQRMDLDAEHDAGRAGGERDRRRTDRLSSPGDWYLGTDNHGQGPDTYAAAGLQIVGQFDYQKSETLARFADGIDETMKEYDVLHRCSRPLREADRPGPRRLPLGHALRHARLLRQRAR